MRRPASESTHDQRSFGGSDQIPRIDGFETALAELREERWDESFWMISIDGLRRCVGILRAQGVPETEAIEWLLYGTHRSHQTPASPGDGA